MNGWTNVRMNSLLLQVGGQTSDPGLNQMISMFQESQLPPSSTHNGNVRKGTTLTFSRYGSSLHTAINNRPVGAIRSPKLCEAMFDLYIGEQPVS